MVVISIVVATHVQFVDSVFLQENVNTVVLGLGLRASGKSEIVSSGDGRDKHSMSRIVGVSYVRPDSGEGQTGPGSQINEVIRQISVKSDAPIFCFQHGYVKKRITINALTTCVYISTFNSQTNFYAQ